MPYQKTVANETMARPSPYLSAHGSHTTTYQIVNAVTAIECLPRLRPRKTLKVYRGIAP